MVPKAEVQPKYGQLEATSQAPGHKCLCASFLVTVGPGGAAICSQEAVMATPLQLEMVLKGSTPLEALKPCQLHSMPCKVFRQHSTQAQSAPLVPVSAFARHQALMLCAPNNWQSAEVASRGQSNTCLITACRPSCRNMRVMHLQPACAGCLISACTTVLCLSSCSFYMPGAWCIGILAASKDFFHKPGLEADCHAQFMITSSMHCTLRSCKSLV